MSDIIKKELSSEIQLCTTKSSEKFFTNKNKLIELLLNEITFLDISYYKTDDLEIRDQISLALEIIENLLKLQRFTDNHLTKEKLFWMKKFIYQTINRISHKINKEVVVK